MKGEEGKLEAVVSDAFRLVHEALVEVGHSLAKFDVTAGTYFNARESILIVWFEGLGSVPVGGEIRE